MNFALVATVFVLIVPAELPDKTFVASLVLATRFRAIPVFIGAAGGLAVQAGIAVGAGSLVSLLPETLVKSISAAVFGFGAILMYRVVRDPDTEEEEVDKEISTLPSAPSDLRVIVTSFLVLFVAEWGDLTQLLTASLSAKYHQPISVFTGSFLGLVTVALLAVTGGKALLRVIPLVWIRRVAAAALATIAVITALQAAKLI